MVVFWKPFKLFWKNYSKPRISFLSPWKSKWLTIFGGWQTVAIPSKSLQPFHFQWGTNQRHCARYSKSLSRFGLVIHPIIFISWKFTFRSFTLRHFHPVTPRTLTYKDLLTGLIASYYYHHHHCFNYYSVLLWLIFISSLLLSPSYLHCFVKWS